MKKKIFQSFDSVNQQMEETLLEVSVKHSRIQFCFDGKISLSDCLKLHEFYDMFGVQDIMAFDNMLYVEIKQNEDFESKKVNDFYKLILELREVLCSCPMLEFVVSDTYIKIFLDVPHVTVENLVKVDELLSDTGIVEVTALPRPYLLYVRTDPIEV